jgi:hypothetical protein
LGSSPASFDFSSFQAPTLPVNDAEKWTSGFWLRAPINYQQIVA